MRWDQGRPTIDGMIARGELERVAPSREHADHLCAQARNHLAAAKVVTDIDPVGAYQLLYDAARKALTAGLENQGIRPTSRGGHVAVYEAAVAQLDPPLGQVLRPFDRMRRRRNDAEYPRSDSQGIESADVARDMHKVEAILDLVDRVLDQMAPY